MKLWQVLVPAFGAVVFVYAQAPRGAPQPPPPPSVPTLGSMEKIKVHGKSLEGNLEGDSADRDVFIYLPPSYKKQSDRRYPVVYFLHGYGIGAERYWNTMKVPEAADKEMSGGGAREMILVHPDAFTIYNGSMYSSSPTTGDWETFIAHDLVAYVDSHYRTVPDRMSRGLAGHSMGGYGTMRIGMKNPDVFSSLYAMSSCCLTASLNPGGRGGAQAEALKSPEDVKSGNNRGIMTLLAEAAAWSPDPKNPPFFFDLPTKDGQPQAETVARWAANAPLAMIDQYMTNLRKMHAIGLEVGLQDTLAASNATLDSTLTRFDIPHTYETYEGNHTNRIPERFDMNLLPFFSKNLKFPAGK
ncbi:MAG TPA: alpha/beta fold hydrolase [Bryobacteraceae bacterium]|jgi:enterochelin esterase-like enzyme|nr:alpha/beta fold hydrolase [Bryobacteraceae bacterium]